MLFSFRSTYKQFVQEIIIEQCKGTKSGKDSKDFDVDHVCNEKCLDIGQCIVLSLSHLVCVIFNFYTL